MTNPDEPEGEPEMGLVMPFVTVESKGGPHADEPYCAGFEMGRLDMELSMCARMNAQPLRSWVIQTANHPQADLIAMRHGFLAVVIDAMPPEWLTVYFKAIPATPGELS